MSFFSSQRLVHVHRIHRKNWVRCRRCSLYMVTRSTGWCLFFLYKKPLSVRIQHMQDPVCIPLLMLPWSVWQEARNNQSLHSLTLHSFRTAACKWPSDSVNRVVTPSQVHRNRLSSLSSKSNLLQKLIL